MNNKIRFFIIYLLVIISQSSYATVVKDSMKVAPFGTVYLYVPEPPVSIVTIMISGDGGWNYGVLDFSEHFAGKGALVIGVDILKYNKDLKSRKDECYHIVSDFVSLATVVEKKYKFEQYQEPMLMGYSSGATLVYAILAQARPNTFAGGISLGFCPDVELPKFFCELNGLKIQPVDKGKSYNLDPDSRLGNRWIVLQGKLDKICDFQNTLNFVNQSSDAELVPLEKVGHGFSRWTDFMPQWDAAFSSIANDKDKTPGSAEKPDSTFNINQLPIILTESKLSDREGQMALFISGDGGWYSFEQNLANLLAEKGISTVGLDAKKYFWNRRTLEESARDISDLLEVFMSKWQKNEILLIGYSMGAEVLPFIIDKLPDNLRQKIKKTILLSPNEKGDFEIHLSNMIGLGNFENTYNVVDELKKISNMVPVHLITGMEENSSLPAKLSETSVQFATVPGDHHYNNDSHAIFHSLFE